MPAYNTLNPPTALYPGDTGLAFNAEQPATGELSQQFALAPYQGNSPAAISIEVSFSGVPGAFQFQIWEADTDNLNDYIEVGSDAITTVNGNNVARLDINEFLGTFIAISCVAANANAVNATVKISRKA